ncbi:MAG: pyruvate dehydrogenase E2 component (dihydrolipoamide acetyltransferase) [Bacteroidetes bacterium]|nr:MAG: pyruvate dehydrogenase E2 component (dihydrolipoamide acetyltransferase) [Bacteroidota bacterium]
MAEIIRMPKLSDTMTEGVVAVWNKKVGDTVKKGEILAEIETDKATMEFESFHNGVLLYIGLEKGQGAPVDSILAIIGAAGEDVSALIAAEKTAAPKTEAKKAEPVAEKKTEPVAEKKAEPVKTAEPAVTQKIAAVAATVTNGNGDSRLKASPLAKKMAEEKGIDIALVKGSGDYGRVVRRDVEGFNPALAPTQQQYALPAAVAGTESFTEETVSQMRKTIARRLAESKFSAPHFYLTMEIGMDEAARAREAINAVSPVKISYNDLVVRAVAAALRRHPKVNSSWLGDRIRYNQHIHVGVAVAVEEGLLVPVIRFADTKSLSQISAETKTYAQKAKDKKLQPTDWEGNTFTISNLGMFGIEEFTAIINPPDACILAVGGIKDTPVVKNGQVVPGKIMKVTLSCDHRVVDGATGAAFLQTLKSMLENPVTILV